MPFRNTKRDGRAGFTLLEALLAMTMLSIVLTGVFAFSIRNLRAQSEASNKLELAFFSEAILDEYLVTRPALPTSGTYKGVWTWEIVETPENVLEATDFDQYFRFVRITATVSRIEDPTTRYSLSTTEARRGSS